MHCRALPQHCRSFFTKADAGALRAALPLPVRVRALRVRAARLGAAGANALASWASLLCVRRGCGKSPKPRENRAVGPRLVESTRVTSGLMTRVGRQPRADGHCLLLGLGLVPEWRGSNPQPVVFREPSSLSPVLRSCHHRTHPTCYDAAAWLLLAIRCGPGQEEAHGSRLPCQVRSGLARAAAVAPPRPARGMHTKSATRPRQAFRQPICHRQDRQGPLVV